MKSPIDPARLRKIKLLGYLLGAILAAIVLTISFTMVGIERRMDAMESRHPGEGAPGRIITVNGEPLHVRVLGDPLKDATGAPLLLLHGFARSGTEFGKIEAALAEQRSILILDRFGAGYSSRSTDSPDPYTPAGEARMIAALLDQLGVPAVDIIGAAEGGAVALRLAVDAPARVRRLALIDARVDDPGPDFIGWLRGLIPFGARRILLWNDFAGGLSDQAALERLCTDASACAAGLDPAWRAPGTVISGTTDALAAAIAAPHPALRADELKALKAPIVILWGERDGLLSAAYGQRLAATLPNAEFKPIAGAGHVPHLEQPAAVIEALKPFLAR